MDPVASFARLTAGVDQVFQDRIEAREARWRWVFALQEAIDAPSGFQESACLGDDSLVSVWSAGILVGTAVIVCDEMNYHVVKTHLYQDALGSIVLTSAVA